MEERRKDGENRRDKVVYPWMRTYPDEAAVEISSVETLAAWLHHLPAPITDAERAIRKRIEVRGRELARAYLQERCPEMLKKLDDFVDAASKLTGKPLEKF